MIGKRIAQQVILYEVLVALVGALFFVTDSISTERAASGDRQAILANEVVPRFSSATYVVRGDHARALVLQTDGKIVVAGRAGRIYRNSAESSFAVARYHSNGSLDSSFGLSGKVTIRIGDESVAHALTLQPDGKFVVAGDAGGSFALVRYQPDGRLDPSFGMGGIVTTAISGTGDLVSALALQADGKIVMAGSFNDGANNEFLLLRYNPDGSLDPTFGIDGTVTTRISSG